MELDNIIKKIESRLTGTVIDSRIIQIKKYMENMHNRFKEYCELNILKTEEDRLEYYDNMMWEFKLILNVCDLLKYKTFDSLAVDDQSAPDVKDLYIEITDNLMKFIHKLNNSDKYNDIV